MKNRISFWKNILLGVLLTTTSCNSNFLDEQLYSNFSTEIENQESKLVGLYRLYGNFWGSGEGCTYLTAFQFDTDIGMRGYSGAQGLSYYLYNQLNSNDKITSYIWTSMYQIISNANRIISQEEKLGEENADKAVIAEAKFFRAYAYNMLVTLYGGVPLITSDEAPRTDYVREPVEKVDQLIDADLTYCIANLPDLGKAKCEARANKDFARQLAGEAYLRMGYKQGKSEYYTKAVDALSDIISNPNYELVSARYGKYLSEGGDCFRDMFRQGNIRRSQGNSEAIWTFEVENPAEVNNGTFGAAPQHRRFWIPMYRNVPGVVNCDSLGGRGNGIMYFTNHVKYGVYEKGDIRNSYYNMRRRLPINKPKFEATYGIDKDGFRVAPDSPEAVRTVVLKTGDWVIPSREDSLTNFYVYSTKWGEYNPKDDFGFAMIKDWPVMRLGETYLLRAEAYFRLNELDKAASDINVLRDRAFADYRIETGNPNAGKVSASDIDIDFILDERIRELITEEQRRITLVRTGTLADRIAKYSDSPKNGAKVTEDRLVQGFDPKVHILLPIPLTEIQLNKDAKIEQNYGY